MNTNDSIPFGQMHGVERYENGHDKQNQIEKKSDVDVYQNSCRN